MYLRTLAKKKPCEEQGEKTDRSGMKTWKHFQEDLGYEAVPQAFMLQNAQIMCHLKGCKACKEKRQRLHFQKERHSKTTGGGTMKWLRGEAYFRIRMAQLKLQLNCNLQSVAGFEN